MQTGDATTVGLRLEAGFYTSLDDLARDVQTVATELLKHVEANQSAPDSRLSSSETKLWTGVKAFQRILHGMISRESQWKSITAAGEEETQVNGMKQEDQDTDVSDMLENGRKVLTIFANPGGPRQLFSSFQKSLRVGAGGEIVDKDSDAVAHVAVPLAEASLPQVISTTTIPQLLIEDGLKPKKSRPTFGEVFAPPVTLPPLHPPRPSKQLITKGSTISFVSNDTLSKRVRRDSRDTYSWVSQPMALGHWLGWGGVDPPQEPTSPEAKRRQRDRALSTGEAKPPLSLSELRDAQQARIDALFRKVYSSFAPSHDDSGAIVSERIKNQAWWNKIGRTRAQNALLIDPELAGDMNTMNTQTIEEEDKEFEKAVEEFEPEDLSDAKMEEKNEPSEKDVDDLLDDISNLIETLYSYQLIRNASLAIAPRTPIGQNSSLTELTGSPDTPSAAEFEVYKTLRVQLAVLITQLPPYAVARLDGDRLKELNISTKILVETSTDSGVMEEDQITRIAKQNALSATVGASSINARGASGTGYTNYPPSATQYNRGTPLQPGSIQRSASSYYPHQQPPSRPPPSLPYSRSTSGLQQYAGSYPTAATPRTGYSQQPYTPTNQRPATFQAGSNPYLQQLPSITGKANYNQQYGYSQGQSRGYNQQVPVSNYQQRTSNATPVYNNSYPQSPYQRTASPLNAGNLQPPQYGAQARPGYSTPVSSGQARSQYFPPGQNPNSQQQAAIERQRAERAAQAQARLAAATASGAQTSMSPGSQRKNSGTPQPQQLNGTPLAA